MKYRAACWVKHNGRWVAPGEVFESNTPEGLTGLADPVNGDEAEPRPEWVGPSAELMPESETAKPKQKRTKKKKSEE